MQCDIAAKPCVFFFPDAKWHLVLLTETLCAATKCQYRKKFQLEWFEMSITIILL